jgi:hypothetical protein
VAELALNKVTFWPAAISRKFLTPLRSTVITRQLLALPASRPSSHGADVERGYGHVQMLRASPRHRSGLAAEQLAACQIDPQIEQIPPIYASTPDAIGVGKVIIETHMVTFDEDYCADHAGFVPGEFVLLAASDDGCGMDKETLDHIFEPFFTTKDVHQGTGLGLSTVYGIVKQNNGFINVYSEPGKGTTFRIYLPCHVGEAEKIRAEIVTEIPPSGNEMVLLVEDESAIREMGRMMLENWVTRC